jgi:hypothetical protein
MSSPFFFIPLPFRPIGSPGRNDVDDFDIFVVILALSGDGVGHEEKEMIFHEAEGLPALFPTLNPILIA